MLSTHIMQEVEAICHRIIIINKGQIVANEEKQNIYSQTRDTTITLLVEFNSEMDEEKIKQLDGVLRLANVKNHEWLIETVPGKDLRQDIFNFAVKNNIAVLSMQRKEKSLEEVFHELTK
jgi:ABC-2 type transport system ATP-binding protein